MTTLSLGALCFERCKQPILNTRVNAANLSGKEKCVRQAKLEPVKIQKLRLRKNAPSFSGFKMFQRNHAIVETRYFILVHIYRATRSAKPITHGLHSFIRSAGKLLASVNVHCDLSAETKKTISNISPLKVRFIGVMAGRIASPMRPAINLGAKTLISQAAADHSKTETGNPQRSQSEAST